jgi:hypothetical protein
MLAATAVPSAAMKLRQETTSFLLAGFPSASFTLIEITCVWTEILEAVAKPILTLCKGTVS